MSIRSFVYRFFITRIITLETEAEALRRVLEKERADFEGLAASVKEADKARLAEREASDARIKELERWIKSYKLKQFVPGVVLGGGTGNNGGAQAVIGVGWKINIF